jgi:hypothetical protein
MPHRRDRRRRHAAVGVTFGGEAVELLTDRA